MDDRERFVAYQVGERGLAAGSVATYLQGLERMERFSGVPYLALRSQIPLPEVRRYFRESTHGKATKRSTLSAAKAWERYGGIEGWWHPDGLLSYQPPLQGPDEPNPPLSLGQVDTLLGAVRTRREVRLCYLGLFEGCRIAESGAMGPEHYLGDRWRFVGKGSKRRDVPMHPEVKAVRRAITFHHLGNGKQLQKVCVNLRDRVGFYFHAHTLRDTFAQRHLDLDAQLEVVESLLGHSHKSMTLRAYARVPWHLKMEAQLALHY